jgi:Tfp pilus assembly protein FimT
MGAARRSARAFTLIEMIVLIIIIAVLASVSAPRYAGFLDRARFDDTVGTVTALLGEARAASLRTGGETTVVFDAQTGSLRARTQNPSTTVDLPAELEENPSRDTGAGAVRPVVLPENVTLGDYQSMTPSARQDSQNAGVLRIVTFLGDGGSTGARLLLVSQEGHRRILEISSVTGRVSAINEETGF